MTRTYKNAKKVIEKETYESIEIMKENLDIFLMGNRITQEEYKELTQMLETKEEVQA